MMVDACLIVMWMYEYDFCLHFKSMQPCVKMMILLMNVDEHDFWIGSNKFECMGYNRSRLLEWQKPCVFIWHVERKSFMKLLLWTSHNHACGFLLLEQARSVVSITVESIYILRVFHAWTSNVLLLYILFIKNYLHDEFHLPHLCYNINT